MTIITKAALFAAIAAPALFVATPAAAQVATANLEGAIQRTTAYTNAINQLQTTYKAQIDQARARETAIQAEIKPQVDAFNAAQRAPNANQQALQTQYNALAQRQQAAQQEIGRILEPVERSRAYILSQFSPRLDAAVKAAMAKKRVTLVVQPQAVLIAQPAADLTADITTELNTVVPSVSITPPAGWQPGQQQGAAPAAAAPAATPARTAPASR